MMIRVIYRDGSAGVVDESVFVSFMQRFEIAAFEGPGGWIMVKADLAGDRELFDRVPVGCPDDNGND
jgi:hypothetical protein